jgi:hypothetical protein
VGEGRNEYNILVRKNLKREREKGKVDADGRTMLKRILKKQSVRVWTGLNHWVPSNMWNFLSGWVSISLSRRILHQGVCHMVSSPY